MRAPAGSGAGGAFAGSLLGLGRDPPSQQPRLPVQQPPLPRGHTPGQSATVPTLTPSRSARQPAPPSLPVSQPVPTLPAPPPPAPLPLDQAEKDGRVVELLHLASAHGCDDLDPEPAVGLLEETGWDVAEALAQLCGRRRGQQVPTALGSFVGMPGDPLPWPPSPSSLSEFEHLRLQQEEWDQSLAVMDAAAQRNAVRAATLRALRQAADRVAAGTAGGAGGEAAASGAGYAQGTHRRPGHVRSRQEVDGELSSGDERSLNEGEAPGPAPGVALPVAGVPGQDHFWGLAGLAGANLLHRGMLDEAYVLAEQEDEALSFQELVRALIRTQDEADFRDAVRLSSEEAYSGGFGVPPADEVVLAASTRTYTYEGPPMGEPSGQCAVCLADFEIGDSLRLLACGHDFHMACVDQWLAQSGQCPVCKRAVGR